MLEISAFIITKNEEERIAKAINSIKKIVKEIIVVDSGSTDNTVEIARDLGARVVFNEWRGYVKQKAFAESLCLNDWILNIDADEELSPELQEEVILRFKKNASQFLAYEINFVILHRRDARPRLFAPSNKFIRIYDRRFSSFANTKDSTTHDAVLFNSDVNPQGKIYTLEAVAYHRSGTSIEQLVAKANFYSTEQAKDLLRSGRKPSRIRISIEFFLWFLKAFFIRRYFVFGFDGFVDSMIFAFARFIRLAKLREIDVNKKNN